jgi:hypothetical protein
MTKKINYRLKQIVCIVMLIHTGAVLAQQSEAINASATGNKNVNVDLFHGRANVSIPIYNFKSRNLSVPITLDYNQVDMKLQEMDYNKGWEAFGWSSSTLPGFIPAPIEYNPGWVGLGWNLNAGGVITRMVKELPDERFNTSGINPLNGNFYATKSDFDPITKRLKDLITYEVSLDGTTAHQKYGSSFEVGEDEFTFNFCGHSGTFLFYQGEWKVFSDEDIIVRKEVNVDSETGEYYISKLSLETSDGIIYTFGGSNAIEFTSNISESTYNVTEPRIATAWFLTQIESPEGDKVIFEYENGSDDDSFSPITRQCTFSSRSKYLDTNTQMWVYNADFAPVSVFPSDDQIVNLSVGSLTNSVYLKKISSTTSPVDIQFYRSTYTAMNYAGKPNSTKTKLDNIYIGGQSAIQFNLLYTTNTNEALKLNSIQETGIASNVTTISLPAYNFEYNPKTETITPQVLNKITYPTGGYCNIEYEKNYLDDRFRVKKLTSKSSATDRSYFTDYYYSFSEARKSDYLESGVGTIAATGSTSIDQTYGFFLAGHQTFFELKKETGYYSPSPDNLYWAFLKRPEIGYSSVWEVQSQESDAGTIVPMGSAHYTFNNYWAGEAHNYASKAGKVESVTAYNAANILTSTCYYSYEERPEDELNRYFTKSYKFSNNSQLFNYSVLCNYGTKSPRYNLIRTDEYKNGSAFITTYKYNYATNHLVEQSVIENKLNYASIVDPNSGLSESNQITTTTTYKYIDEFNTVTLLGDISDFINYLPHCTRNIPVETVVKKDGKIIAANLTKFKALPTPDRTLFYRPFEVYSLNISAPINESDFKPTAIDWTIQDSRYNLKTTFDLYDSSGNILEYHNTGSSHVSYSYDIYQQPLIELKNCTNQELLNTGQAGDPIKLRKLLPNTQITSYTYTPIGGVTSVAGPNGVSTYKEYDELGRLKYVKDNNGKILLTKEYNFNIQ